MGIHQTRLITPFQPHRAKTPQPVILKIPEPIRTPGEHLHFGMGSSVMPFDLEERHIRTIGSKQDLSVMIAYSKAKFDNLSTEFLLKLKNEVAR